MLAPSARLVWALGLVAALASAVQTVVIPVLAPIGSDLGLGPGALSWVLTATLLSSAVTTPLAGRLGDRFGYRPVLLACLAVVLAGAVTAALAPSGAWLIAGRTLQGAASGTVSLAFAVIRNRIPGERVPASVAVVSCALSVGGGLSMVAAGFVVQVADSNLTVFWPVAALAAAAIAGVVWAVPRTAPQGEGGIDALGAALLGATLVLLLLPLSKADSWGVASPPAVACLAAAPVFAALLLAVERRARHPLVDPGLFTRSRLLAANAVGLLTGIGLFGLMLGASGFVQTRPEVYSYGFGADPLSAATGFLVPTYLAGGAVAIFAGWLVPRLGAERVVRIGALLAASAFAAMLAVHSSAVAMALAFCAAGMGISIAVSGLPLLIMAAVPDRGTGVANAVNMIFRSIGYSVAGAGSVAVIAARTPPGAGAPALDGYLLIFGLCGMCCVLAAAAVSVLIRRGRRRGPTGAAPDRDLEAS